jgi:glycosyltransferase involved in cell wall biosynthesis|tara:strand:- start:977 stop:2239 length:1263 start_codon:yes stop_codon:yes gene_type:complete
MKPVFVISSPFDTYSGYGARSRDVIKAIVETDKYDVKLLSQRWGNTPFGFCKDNSEWSFLLELVTPMPLTEQPEIWTQISVPNEFQPVGKYNIGITAGIETTLAPGEWIDGCNKMNLILTSSEHSKSVFMSSEFEKRNAEKELLGKTKLETPIEVLFEGANTDVYKQTNIPCSIDIDIKESFAYLFVGHWMEGNLGEDRKNTGLLVKAFLETFKNKKKKPALIMKTSHVGASHMDRDSILNKIKLIKETVNSNDLPNIYLLHGDFSDDEMNEIYNHSKIKSMISLTKGEGFGRPLLEFSLSKKPIIVTGWSGHMDFLKPEYNIIIGGQLTNVHESVKNPFLLKEAQWFSPNHSEIGTSLTEVFTNYKKYQPLGKRQGYYSKENFSWNNMKSLLSSILEKNIPEFPKEIKLSLPKLTLPKL